MDSPSLLTFHAIVTEPFAKLVNDDEENCYRILGLLQQLIQTKQCERDSSHLCFLKDIQFTESNQERVESQFQQKNNLGGEQGKRIIILWRRQQRYVDQH